MNKQSLIGLISLLVLGGGLVAAKQYTSQHRNTNQTQTQQQTTSKQTLADIFKKKESMVCTIKTDGRVSKIYIKGDKIRFEGDTTIDGKQAGKTYFIQNGQYSYMWNDQSNKGLKFPTESEDVNDESPEDNSPQAETAKPFDLQAMKAQWENSNYQCQPQKLNDDIFMPPANIKFQDMSQLMKTMEEMQNNPQNAEQQLQHLKDMFGEK